MDSEKRVMSGTWGEVWLDGDYVGECYKFQAKDTYNRETIHLCGKLRTGKKLMSIEGTGSMGLYKVSSRMAQKIGEILKQGQDPSFRVISKLDDPDAYGAERIAFYGVRFDDITLADWEVGVNGKTEHSFSFDDYEFLDAVEVQ